MQLSKLNSAIREADVVKARFAFGAVALQKTSLLEALKAHFGGQRTAETGLAIVEGGYLQFTSYQQIDANGAAADWVQPSAAAEPEADLDEELGRNDDDTPVVDAAGEDLSDLF